MNLLRPWRFTCWVLVGYLFLLASYWLAYAFAPAFHQHFLRGEDKLIEWLTFAGFFAAAVVIWRCSRETWLANTRPMGRGYRQSALIYFAGLGFFFFICAGEEISWGQRILGFGTPDEIRQANEQREFNLHNLKLEHISPVGVVSLFMKVFGIAAPLIAWNRWPRFIPVATVAPSFIFAEALSFVEKLLKPGLVERFGLEVATVVRLDTAEFKEMVWGLSALLAATLLRTAWRQEMDGTEAVPPRANGGSGSVPTM